MVLVMVGPLRGEEPAGEPAAPPSLQIEPAPERVEPDAFPIDWPSVLRLARAGNLEIQLATEKVHQAHLQLGMARQQWLPSLQVGANWLHHDGRTQTIPGRIIEASKSSLYAGGLLSAEIDPQKVAVDVLRAKQQVYRESGSLDRTTRETLQEASLAYINLVAAQAGAAITLEITEKIEHLLKRSEDLLEQGEGTKVDVLQNRASFQSQLKYLKEARQNQLSASARLVELLNLQPSMRLVSAEDKLVPVQLVDENRSTNELITLAIDQGPGIAEVVAMIGALEQQEEQLRVISFFPSVSLDVGQGTFGGGFGGSYGSFADRGDYDVNVRWDLMSMIGNAKTRELFESQRRQAKLNHRELEAKLAAGVTVAQKMAQSAKDCILLAEREIEYASELYEISRQRLEATETLSLEVSQAIRAFATARKNYLSAIIDYNRAQVNLQFLIGFQPVGNGPDHACVTH